MFIILYATLALHYTRLDRLTRDKRFSLFCDSIDDEGNPLLTLTTVVNVINLFSLSLMNMPDTLEH